MTEESAKTYVFDSARGSMDPSTLLALMNGGNGGFGGGNWMWIIFLFFLYGWGGNGFGGFGRGFGGGLGNQINEDYGTSLLLQAINGNGTAISQLASTLNCDVNSIRTAVDSVGSSICQLGNTVNMTSAQVISAINQGNQALSSQLAQCCCDNRLATCQTQNIVQNESSATRFADANNTRDIIDSQTRGTQAILDKLCTLELDGYKRENDNLRSQLNMATLRESQTAQNAFISANQEAQTATLLRRLGADCPTPAYVVQPPQPVTFPTNCCGQVQYANYGNNGCGGGCGGF